MTIAWPTAVPIADVSMSIEAHSRGYGDAREPAFAIGGGARWVASLDVPALSIDAACNFQGFLHSLRGGSFTLVPLGGTVFPAPAASRYTDGTTHTDGMDYTDTATGTVTTAAASAGDPTLTIAAYSTAIAVGDFLMVGGELKHVVSVVGSVIGIRPRARNDLPIGTFIQAYGILPEWRLSGEVPDVPLRQTHSSPLSVDIEEAY